MFFTDLMKYCAALLIVLFLHGCAGGPAPVPPSHIGIELNEICSQYHVTWQWDGVTQVVLLEFQGNKAKALVGSSVVMVNKDRINLSLPLRRVNSSIYVPDDFESKVLVPLGAVTPQGGTRVDWSRMRVHTVVIDPGHGGKDPGTQGSSGLKEKTVVLDISKHIRNYLQEAGLKVILTRDNDEFISLPQRTEITTKSDADLFVSIHANSNPTRKTEGIEVYFCKTRSKTDLDEDQRAKNEKMFVKKLNSIYSPVLEQVLADMMYAQKVAQSESFAQKIVNHSSSEAGGINRGSRFCRFFVVRNTLIPAVLVEVGYLTNRHEEKKLSTPAYRQKIAQAIANSIIKYATDP